MKKTFLIVAVAALTVVSCKKDRTCECTNTVVSSSSTEPGYTYTPQPATTNSTKYTKIKKSNVLAQTCVSSTETQTYIDQSYNSVTGSVEYYTVTEVSKSDCKLK